MKLITWSEFSQSFTDGRSTWDRAGRCQAGDTAWESRYVQCRLSGRPWPCLAEQSGPSCSSFLFQEQLCLCVPLSISVPSSLPIRERLSLAASSLITEPGGCRMVSLWGESRGGLCRGTESAGLIATGEARAVDEMGTGWKCGGGSERKEFDTRRRKILEMECDAHWSKGRCPDRKQLQVHSIAMAQLAEGKSWIHTPSLCKKCC